MKRTKVLITGVTGQDGSYLSDLFLHLGYEVHGLVRRSSTFNTQRIDHIIQNSAFGDKFFLHYGDMADSFSANSLVSGLQPQLIINMAAQSHVKISFDMPNSTIATNTSGVLNYLEAIKLFSPETKFYQASTSEMFGNSPAPQSIKTGFAPESPYAISKLSAHELVRLWREAYGIKAVSGVLFNHESYRRGLNFVTKKIVVNAKRIHSELKTAPPHNVSKLKLGNLTAIRDWGWAPEYMAAVCHILNSESSANTMVLGTGLSASVMDFGVRAFNNFGLNFEEWVEHDPSYERPVDVHQLRADTSELQKNFSWTPTWNWKALCDRMSEEELRGQENSVDWDLLIGNIQGDHIVKP